MMQLGQRRHASRRPSRLAGIATIEFVLSLPFLFVLMAMIYTMGSRTLDQIGVAMAVRDTAWLKRSAVEGSPTASAPFRFDAAGSGSVRARKRRRLRIFPWLGGRRLSEASTRLIAGSWDHRQTPELRGGRPHLDVLDQLGVGGGVDPLTRLLDF